MKRLDGWEPEERHAYSYDEAGRVESVTVTREAEWDPDEQGLMLALALYRAQVCPAGHWLPEAGAPENEYAYRGRNSRCHACTTVAREMEKFRAAPQPSGLLFGAELVTTKRG